MTKRIIAILAIIMTAAIAMAQNIEETTIHVGSLTVPAFTVSIPQDDSRAESLMKKQFKEWRVSTTRQNGFVIAIGETISEFASSPINFYSKIYSEGRRDNKTTVITVAAVSSNLSVDQSTLNASVRKFLATFAKRVAQDEATEKVAEVQKRIDKVKKTADAATATIATIDKDIAKRQSKIDAKKQEIEKMQTKIENIQKEITEEEAEIQKYTTKKEEYTQKAEAANKEIEEANAEIEKYKSLVK